MTGTHGGALARGQANRMSMRVAAAVVAIAVAALAAAGIVALAGSGDPVPQVERGVPVETVLADPGEFTAQSVTVTGEADIVTDRAMTMGERDLIVVAADPREQNFEVGGFEGGQRVHATGTLRIMDAEETVDRLPGPSLLPPQFQGFGRQPVLVASAVIGA